MILEFDVCSYNKKLQITDHTQDIDNYVSEDLEDQELLQIEYSKGNYKYSDTITINIIRYMSNENDSGEISKIIYTKHESYLDECYFNVPKDGYYQITHMVLPTVEWFQNNIESISPSEDQILDYYFTDGENIFMYSNGQLIQVDTAIFDPFFNTEYTNISRAYKNVFVIDRLFECYISKCKQVFNQVTGKCSVSKINMFDIDLVWMTYNIIKYYVDMNQFYEAQRLLTRVTSCNVICQDNNLQTSSKSSGCGCNK